MRDLPPSSWRNQAGQAADRGQDQAGLRRALAAGPLDPAEQGPHHGPQWRPVARPRGQGANLEPNQRQGVYPAEPGRPQDRLREGRRRERVPGAQVRHGADRVGDAPTGDRIVPEAQPRRQGGLPVCAAQAGDVLQGRRQRRSPVERGADRVGRVQGQRGDDR